MFKIKTVGKAEDNRNCITAAPVTRSVFGSLASKYPALAKEWHPFKNESLSAEQISPGTGRKVWWQCPQGHEYTTSVWSRVNHQTGCPHCKTKNVLTEHNPKAAKMFNAEKTQFKKFNQLILDPALISANSQKLAWWRCENGHEWQEAVNMVAARSAFPCKQCLAASQPDSLKVTHPDIAQEWHPKNKLSADDLTARSKKKVWWRCKQGHEWNIQVRARVKSKGCQQCIKAEKLDRDNLQVQYPEIAAQLDSDKNNGKTGLDYLISSRETVWWRCENGHEWQTKINSRVTNQSGCPQCVSRERLNKTLIDLPDLYKQASAAKENKNHDLDNLSLSSPETLYWLCSAGHLTKRQVSKKIKNPSCPDCKKSEQLSSRNLASEHPDLIQEWHPTKNKGLTPKDFFPNSTAKVWWLCENGHEWQRPIKERSLDGNRCPQCKITMLSETMPEMEQFWDQDKNTQLFDETGFASGYKAHWKCPRGHEWQSSVQMMERKKHKCSKCRKIDELEENNFADNCPHLIEEIAWDRNQSDFDPKKELAYGTKKIWWRCENGHEWQATLRSRYLGSGCSYCQGRLAHENHNLAVYNPELIKEWHPDKNLGLTPEDVTPKTGKKVWWRCDQGHEWQAQISNRSGGGSGCPECSGRKIGKDNNLAVLFPEIAKQLANKKLNPKKLSPRSSDKHTWICAQGHQWETSVYKRTVLERGCPVCEPPQHGGFKPEQPGYLYLMKSEEFDCWQVGITNVPKQRIKAHGRQGKFEIVEMAVFEKGADARAKEKEILDFFKTSGYSPAVEVTKMPHGGATETVSRKDIKNFSLNNWIDKAGSLLATEDLKEYQTSES